jgi:hypothetical protein
MISLISTRLCNHLANLPAKTDLRTLANGPPRLSQLCPPCATPSSNSSLDYRRSDARIVKNGFAASSGVSKSAKVVLGRVLINAQIAALLLSKK